MRLPTPGMRRADRHGQAGGDSRMGLCGPAAAGQTTERRDDESDDHREPQSHGDDEGGGNPDRVIGTRHSSTVAKNPTTPGVGPAAAPAGWS